MSGEWRSMYWGISPLLSTAKVFVVSKTIKAPIGSTEQMGQYAGTTRSYHLTQQ